MTLPARREDEAQSTALDLSLGRLARGVADTEDQKRVAKYLIGVEDKLRAYTQQTDLFREVGQTPRTAAVPTMRSP